MKLISSNHAGSLVDYITGTGVSAVDQLDQDRATGRPRVMFTAAQHCRAETAKEDFEALRIEHGRQGETRTVPAKYVAADQLEPGVEPTHVKVGKNWRAAKKREQATHLRIEPQVPLEKRAEANHFIISFAPDTVNMDDPEQCRKAFEAVEAMMAQDYAGVQAVMVGQADAKGSRAAQERGEDGKFHVHIATNAVIHSEMEVDGRVFSPGQRMSGALTHVDTFRRRWDTFLETRGHEFSLEGQNRDALPEVGSPEYRAKSRRSNHDFWENERGAISDHDKARRGLETAFEALAEDLGAMAQLSSSERLQRLASEVAITGDVDLKLRSTNSGPKIRSFVVPGRKQAIGATRLGGRYTNDDVAEQLELIAQGQWKPIEHHRSGPVQPIADLSDKELAELQRTADQLAEQEVREQKLDAWLADRAAAAGLSVEEQWAVRGMSGSPADLALAHGWKSDWDAERSAQEFAELLRQAEAAIPGHKVVAAQPAASPQTPDVDTPTTPEVAATPLPQAAEVDSEVKSQAADTSSSAAPAKPRRPRYVGRLTPRQMQDRELIAVVMQERQGGAYVSFELAADDPVAAGRDGLFLHAHATERINKDGNRRKVTNTWQQLNRADYAALQLAAGENATVSNGKQVFAVRGDIVPWGGGGVGYNADLDSLSPSRSKGVGDDVLARQQRSEDRARMDALKKASR